MRFGIKLGEKRIGLEEKSPTGVLLFSEFSEEGQREVLSLDEIKREIEIWVDSRRKYPLSASNWRLVLKLAKILGFSSAGVLLFAGRELFSIEEGKHEILLVREIFNEFFDEERWINLLVEATVGEFKRPSLKSPFNLLFDREPDELAEEFFKTASCVFTRIVGFSYREDNFVNEEDELILKPGDRIFLVREPENEHDPRAIAVLWKNGELLGYLRRTIAKHLSIRLDKGEIMTGEITAILSPRREPDERVFIKFWKK